MLDTLKDIPLLKKIEPSRWAVLEPYITYHELVAEQTLFECGQKSRSLYVVLKGQLNLYLPATTTRREVLVDQRHYGDTAGDFAVLNGGEHLVTSRAATHTLLARFPHGGFEKLAGLNPQILSHAYETAARLSRRVLLIKSFFALFVDMTDGTLSGLLKDTEIRHLRSGEELFRQGDATDGLYIVMAGRLPIVIEKSNGETRTIGEAKAPQMVGEFSLITGSTRAATVFASRESMVAFLNKEKFEQYILQKPHLLASVSRMIVERQNTVGREIRKKGRLHHIAIVPLSQRIPLKRIIHLLKRELRASSSTFAIDSHQFDTLYGKVGAAQTAFADSFNSSVTAWLDDRESRYGHVLYVADNDWSPWTHRCLNRADRILLLADMRDTCELREIEQKIRSMFATRAHEPRVEYAFLHPEYTAQPQNTAAWLRPRTMAAYHHVRMEDMDHFARLARRLTGRAHGLVLSGGGARGYVHLGVHRALEETALPIDYIGGTSMGALLGGALAMGMSASRIFELSERFANPRALFDYTLPITALMKSAKLTRFCHGLFQEMRIEDLWTPYFCMSSNLSLGTSVCHQDGLLWRAVRSSIAIPGVFSPVPQDNGELLVDGAVLNNFPVEQMAHLLFGGTLIGVNVGQVEALEDNYNYGMSLSGWKTLGNWLNPFNHDKTKTPGILETLLRANDIKSIESQMRTRQLLDLLIEPQVTSFSLLDFRAFAQITEIGYQSAVPVFSDYLKQQQL